MIFYPLIYPVHCSIRLPPVNPVIPFGSFRKEVANYFYGWKSLVIPANAGI